MRAMLVKVAKDENNKIRQVEFTFESEDDIPKEILQFARPELFKEQRKEQKIVLLNMILKSTEEDLEDAGYPDPSILSKIEQIKGLIEYVKANDCICEMCKADANNTSHEDALNDLLKANGISPN